MLNGKDLFSKGKFVALAKSCDCKGYPDDSVLLQNEIEYLFYFGKY